ncbi:hypothetical protein BWD13_14865 [Leptospira santarosai serovar Grippotyphosa]|nr:hypothetical protein BWD13_14865 [Leptospira santarosai serovar Grippotyphosa]
MRLFGYSFLVIYYAIVSNLRITRPLTLFAELNDTALYGSQRQVLGHCKSKGLVHRMMRLRIFDHRFQIRMNLRIIILNQLPK